MLGAIFDLARPVLLSFEPETAHELSLKALERGVHPRQLGPDDPRLAQSLFGLDFPNPIGIAAMSRGP
jgi:dihydroorotate dehydrogenase